MSSKPGSFLEDFIEWNHNGVIFDELLALYEPYRDDIEWWLDQFDDENQSWRDYADGCPVEIAESDIKRVMDELYERNSKDHPVSMVES